MPRMRWRVVCAFFDVMLTRAPTSALTRVDLPTLGRPTIATWPQRVTGGGASACLGAGSGMGGDCVGGGSRDLLRRATTVAAPVCLDAERSNPADDVECLQMGL